MTAIHAEHLSKNYKLSRERTRTLKETILRQYAPAEQVQALRDVSFSVNSGESFGVVGANGSGKSTLLKLLAGTAKPTTGTLEVNGRVTALLEIGAGFHPDFSGRENAYLNGSLFGLSRKQMDRTMPAIEEFADDPDRREAMGRAGRELAESQFSWRVIVDRWLQEIGYGDVATEARPLG